MTHETSPRSTDALDGPEATDGWPPRPDTDTPDTPDIPGAQPPSKRRRRISVLLLTAVWAVWVVVQYLLSGRWWLMLVPDMVPPLAFVAVPALLLVATGAAHLRRRRAPSRTVTAAVVVLAALSLALGWSFNGLNLGALFGQRHTGTPNLRVVSWNTRWWGHRTERQHFYRTIQAQHADVYLLQEYIATDRTGANVYKINELGLLHKYFPGYHIGIRGELVTLSRLPVVSEYLVGPGAQVEHTASGTPWLEVYALAKTLRTDVRVGGKVVSLYNVHIPVQMNLGTNPLTSTFYQFIRKDDRTRQPQFRGLAADLRSNSHPSLVAGDFNTTAAMGDLKTLRGMLHDAASASSSVYPVSWNELWNLPLWRLDWAFTQHHVTVDSYALRKMGDRLSDHKAQILELTV